MKLSIGAAQFGLNYGISNLHGIVKETEIESVLNHAIKNLIDTIDTAQAYGNSEGKLGHYDLSKFKIITKLASCTLQETICHSVGQSLKRLNIEKLYGLLFHCFDDFKRNPNIIKTLEELKGNGVVEKIGFTLYHPSELEYLLENEISFDLIQIPFSIFDQRFKAYFDILEDAMIEIHVRSIYLQGLVFIEPEEMNPFFDEYKGLFRQFRSFCQNHNVSISSLCLHYANSFPQIKKIVVGITSLDEFQNNIQNLLSEPDGLGEILPKLNQFEIKNDDILLPFNWRLS